MLTARLNVLAMVFAAAALFAGLSAAVEDRSALLTTRKLHAVADTCGHETVCSTTGQLSCQDYHPQCTIHNHYGEGSCCCCPSGAVPSPSPPAPASPSPASPPSPILPVLSPPPPVLSPPPPSPASSPPPSPAAAQVCARATTTEYYVINFMGGRAAADTHCQQGICGGQDYACTNGTGMPRVSFTDRGNATTQTVIDLMAMVQRASTAPAELVFYLNDREEGRIPPATGTTLVCGSTPDQCTVQQLDVPNPGSYDVGGLNNVRLDDDMGLVTCYPLLILRVTYQLNSCMNTAPPPPTPPSPVTVSASAAATAAAK